MDVVISNSDILIIVTFVLYVITRYRAYLAVDNGTIHNKYLNKYLVCLL